MTLNYATPVVNPRLGSGFAIFASTYTCLVLLLVVLEQLGLSAPAIDQLIVTVPVLFYIAIGFMTRTIGTSDFLLAGQRVPPFYNALALCGTVFGGSHFAGQHRQLLFCGHRRDCHPAWLLRRADPYRRSVRPASQEGRRQYLAGVLASEVRPQPRQAGGILARDRTGRDGSGRRGGAWREDSRLRAAFASDAGHRARRGHFLYGHRLRLPVSDRRSGRHARGDLDASGAIHRRSKHFGTADFGFGDADEFAAASAHLWQRA